MSRRTNAVKLAFRLGRRELRRNPLPTALIVILIAIPTALAAMVVTVQHRVKEGSWDFQTNAIALGATSGVELPDGAAVIQFGQSRLQGSIVGRRAVLELNDIVVGRDPNALFTKAKLHAGRYPRVDGEALVDRLVAEVDGIELGDRIQVPGMTEADRSSEFVVTGIRGELSPQSYGASPSVVMVALGDPGKLKFGRVVTLLNLPDTTRRPE